MKKTLLQKAKESKNGKRVYKLDDEMIEVAVAWAKDEVGLVQVCRAIYGKGANARGKGIGVYMRLARGLKAYIQKSSPSKQEKRSK